MNKKALTGGEAIAYAMKQINPEVVAMYPITPQTPVIESFAKFVADGKVNSELIRTESEHSALSVTVGASSAGVRAMTATASQGLLYMFEMLPVASGLRLPIVMPVVNRATSAPINIHCDHSDSMSAVDQGWIQFYCINAQEAYELTLFALRLSEAVLLPTMVCIDGFITSHNLVGVELFEDDLVKSFIGEFKPAYSLLDTENPITVGALALTDYYFEIRAQMFEAFNKVKEKFIDISKEFEEKFNKRIKVFEDYFASNADIVLVVLSSTAGTAKEVIDRLRKDGKNVGLLRPILYRPFLYDEYSKVLKNAKKIIVLERSEGPGSFPPLYKDISLAKGNAEVYSYVFGLGGREILEEDIEKLIMSFINNKIQKERYVGLRR